MVTFPRVGCHIPCYCLLLHTALCLFVVFGSFQPEELWDGSPDAVAGCEMHSGEFREVTMDIYSKTGEPSESGE